MTGEAEPKLETLPGLQDEYPLTDEQKNDYREILCR